jgi:methylated-DNA-[protein]-cysteine S-methyltransferase
MTAGALTIDSPLGPITLTERNGALATVTIAAVPGPQQATPLLKRTAQQLAEYFAGERTDFDLPLLPATAPFQQRMRDAMLAIPYGKTQSYGELAQAIGSVARAVGQACGDNLIPIIVPCHRVLAAGGGIGGFSAPGGITTKRWLLAHETRFHPPADDLFAHAR